MEREVYEHRAQVDGKTVEIAGLPLIFQQCRDDGLTGDSPDAPARLLEVVRIYHAISGSEAPAYAAALAAAYRTFQPAA